MNIGPPRASYPPVMRPMCSVLLLAATLAAPPSMALAEEEPNEAATARLGLLRPAERELLAPHLARGPIAFVEFAETTELPAIVLAAEVHAPASRVAALVADPASYPGFMPALDSVDMRSRRGRTIAYGWTWRTSIFTLRGENVMTVYPSPGAAAAVHGHRIGVRSTEGDLGEGRTMWRIYPLGPNRSLLVLASRIDMRQANYIARQLSAGGNGVNRTINISLGFVMLLATKAEAERRAGWSPPAVSDELPPLREPDVDMQGLAPMLVRGDLLLIDMHGSRIAQVTAVGRMGLDARRVRAVMTSPEAFGRSLVQGSRAEVISRDDSGVLFEWRIPLPLVGASGRMRLADHGHLVTVDGVSGSLSEGRWRFRLHDYPWQEAGVIAWGRFDPADASWLLRRLVDGIPWFNHGLTAGSQVMVMRSIRSRAWGR